MVWGLFENARFVFKTAAFDHSATHPEFLNPYFARGCIFCYLECYMPKFTTSTKMAKAGKCHSKIEGEPSWWRRRRLMCFFVWFCCFRFGGGFRIARDGVAFVQPAAQVDVAASHATEGHGRRFVWIEITPAGRTTKFSHGFYTNNRLCPAATISNRSRPPFSFSTSLYPCFRLKRRPRYVLF